MALAAATKGYHHLAIYVHPFVALEAWAVPPVLAWPLSLRGCVLRPPLLYCVARFLCSELKKEGIEIHTTTYGRCPFQDVKALNGVPLCPSVARRVGHRQR